MRISNRIIPPSEVLRPTGVWQKGTLELIVSSEHSVTHISSSCIMHVVLFDTKLVDMTIITWGIHLSCLVYEQCGVSLS